MPRFLPGQADDVDYLGYGLAWARRPRSGDDEDAARLGEHVSGRRLGLGRVPGRAGAVMSHVAGGVPGRGDGPAGELERDGALYGAVGACPVPKAYQASSITTPMPHLTESVRLTGEYAAKPRRSTHRCRSLYMCQRSVKPSAGLGHGAVQCPEQCYGQ